MQTTKAVCVHGSSGPEALTLEDVPFPQAQGDEAALEVHVAGAFPAVQQDRLPALLGATPPGRSGAA